MLFPGASLPSWLQQPTSPTPCTAPNQSGCAQTEGAQPVTNTATSEYSAWTTTNGYTVLDLTQFTGTYGFSNSNALLFTLRNTLPNSSFNCSGSAVPYNTAVYTNVDTDGAGLMGPYVPLVDFVDPNNTSIMNSTTQAPTGALPNAAYCGVVPTGAPSVNAPTPSHPVDFPMQYWSETSTMPPDLYCPTTAPDESSTQIYFVATQYTTPAVTEFGTTACTSTSNSCSQIVVQSTQTTEIPGGTAFQPALAIAITGTGFGFLPQPIPFAGLAASLVSTGGSQLLTIKSDGAGSGTPWSTNPTDAHYTTACQVYIANWTDTSIWLVANLPVNVQDYYQSGLGLSTTFLSALSDFSPETFPGESLCPVSYGSVGDTLHFTVTNPQNGSNTGDFPVQVSPTTGTTLF